MVAAQQNLAALGLLWWCAKSPLHGGVVLARKVATAGQKYSHDDAICMRCCTTHTREAILLIQFYLIPKIFPS